MYFTGYLQYKDAVCRDEADKYFTEFMMAGQFPLHIKSINTSNMMRYRAIFELP